MGGGRDQEAATGAGEALGTPEGAEMGSMFSKLTVARTGEHIPNRPLPAGRLLPLVLAALLALLVAPATGAHPADMYIQVHTIRLTPDGIRCEWLISPAPILAQVVWNQADLNGDQSVSPGEALAWAQPVSGQLAATVDDTMPLTWRLGSVVWPTSFDEFQVGGQAIRVQLTADWPSELRGEHRLWLHNDYEESITINWFYLHGGEGITFRTPDQQRGQLAVQLVIPESSPAEVSTSPSTEEPLLDYWESGAPSFSGVAETVGLSSLAPETVTSTSPSVPGRTTTTILTGLVRTPNPSPVIYLLALLFAVLLGALHALTPGHGKAVVAAYLVGSQGTAWHAAALGIVVTITHTSSVFALGLVTLLASRYILPTTLFPVLEIASGVLIAGLGAHLLIQRWCTWRQEVGEGRISRAGRPSIHYDAQAGRQRITLNQPIRERGPSHNHDDPSRRDYIPKPDPGAPISWRSLVALGISGGLVPCPDAIAILLVAVTINRIVLGLSLIVAFSLGLAVILIIIGLSIVRGQRLFQRLNWFNRVAPAMPVASAAVVLALGLALMVTAAGRAGMLAWTSGQGETPGRVAQGDVSGGEATSPPAEPFHLDRASILYIAGDERGRNQLFVLALSGGQTRALTQGQNVWDYALSPDRTTVVYTALREEEFGRTGGSDLWVINVDGGDGRLLLDCAQEVVPVACSGPVWSPDGRWLIYERRDIASVGDPLALTSLWWLEVPTGETGPVFQDGGWPGFNPSWSPDGQWLSYASPGSISVLSYNVQIYNLQDGRTHSVSNRTGKPALWHPDSSALLMTEARTEGDLPLLHLLRYDLESQDLTDLSGGGETEDSWAAWSPDGEWIAVVRREFTVSGAAMGDDVWLISADGGSARRLTEQPKMVHQAPAWSPDGRCLLFQQYALEKPNPRPGIWLLNVETGELQEVVTPGLWPTWLP